MKFKLRLLSFWLVSLTLVQGQGVLDSAPGTTPTTGPAPAAPATNSVPLPTIPVGTSLLSNGDFALATKVPDWPDDWDKPGRGAVTWKSESGKNLIRLEALLPDDQTQLYRVIDLPPGVAGLDFNVRYRTANLKKGQFPEDNAQVILEFLDHMRKPIAAAPPLTFADSARDWTSLGQRMAVPPGAEHLAIMPCLYRVDSGTLDLARIQVVSLSDSDAAAVAKIEADAAVQKLAAQDAVIEADLALPAKSVELKASGNRLVTVGGRDILLQGVNICNLTIRPDEEHKILWTTHVALTDWKANVIRLAVLDSFWFGKGRGAATSNDPAAYRVIVDRVIRMAAGKGAYIVFDLHRYLTPDASCVAFWQDAAVRYKNNPAVLFDIMNEPHDTSWEIWRNGGTVQVKGKQPQEIQSVGMQALVDAVRGVGAKNLIVAGGLGYAYDLSGIVNGYALDDKGGNGIMYATHFYNWHGNWAKHIFGTAAKYPVLVGEFGADLIKMGFIPANKQEDPYTWAPDALGFVQANHLNWTAFSMHTRATPNMLLNWDYNTPTPYWGAFVKDALAGKEFKMRRER